jgi:hypothetical protein
MVAAFVCVEAVAARAQEGNRPGAAFLCDSGAVAAKQAEFQRLLALKRYQPWLVSDEALRIASAAYVASAESCHAALTSPATFIDDGPLMPWEASGAAAPFALIGAKWGSGTAPAGVDVRGPGTPGGRVTYSFMGTGVDMGWHSDVNQSVSSLPGFQACFLTEIREAFAAWSAVANIQFVEIADNGVPFDAPGARGDIRIGAHAFDGQWGALAHAYYPPPGGTSAAGDIHFDRHENYSCTSGAGNVDIGIVAAHEIGHAIGLAHETRAGRTAMMNPYYNPVSAPMLLADDVEGAVSLYGSGVSSADSLMADFGSAFGLWNLNFDRGWQQVIGSSPAQYVTGDLDGNGIDDVAASFTGQGVWIRWNGGGWAQLTVATPTLMGVGDLDANRRFDLVLAFDGLGLYAWSNAATWTQLHRSSPSVMALGNVDGAGGDDIVATFTGQGVWTYRHGSGWSGLNAFDATAITIGPLDDSSGPEDILFSFPGFGLYTLVNLTTWKALHFLLPAHAAIGNLDGDARGEIVVDFGPGVGIWLLENQTTWSLLHGFPSEATRMGDLDGNGRADVVVDFGPDWGFWIFMNGSNWLQGHLLSPTDLKVAYLK